MAKTTAKKIYIYISFTWTRKIIQLAAVHALFAGDFGLIPNENW